MNNNRRCSACRIIKDISEFSPKSNQCRICRRLTSAKYRNANKEKCYAASKLSVSKNPESVIEIQKRHRQKNIESVKAKHKKYKEKHGDRWKQLIKQWSIDNRDKKLAAWAKRRAVKKNAMPSWANEEKILEFYKEAKRLTDETGIRYVVDHIIPLQGNNVCGLHVEGNLRVITNLENMRKGNRVIESLIYQ